MRRVTFGAAASLDGYIARASGGLDWLRWSPDVASAAANLWATYDTVVMGRMTHEAAVREGTTSYPSVANYVCSQTVAPGRRDGVEFVRDGVALVTALREQPGKGICIMGGGVLGRSLIDAGLVDEIGVNVHPVLLGSGVPLFQALRSPVEMALLQCSRFENGCVLLRYEVDRRAH
jgi:dihydrofolate reductase